MNVAPRAIIMIGKRVGGGTGQEKRDTQKGRKGKRNIPLSSSWQLSPRHRKAKKIKKGVGE